MTTRSTNRVTTSNPDENGQSKMEAMLALLLKKQEEQDAKIAALLKENEELKARPTGRVAKPVTLQTSQRETTCGICNHKIGIGADVALKYGHKPMCADCFNSGKTFVESAMRIYETQKTVFCAGCEKKLSIGSAAYYSKAKHASYCRSCAHPETGKKQHDGDEI